MDSRFCCALLTVLLAATGCRSHDHVSFGAADAYLPFVQQIEQPDLTCELASDGAVLETVPPPTVRRPEETEKWPLTLEEAIRMALANSEVIRDLGGRVVTAPDLAPTIYDPALADADPRFGSEAALAAFDAQLATSAFWQQQDRAANNIFIASSGLFTTEADFRLGLRKTAATGAEFSLENITLYNRNNNFMAGGFNLFPSFYDTLIQAEVRQPLLQGGGVEFNRIAGPRATPGNYGGVLIARLNSDITLADFEAAVRDLLRDVERTYWELYFAYRDFDAKREGRQLALESWELEKTRYDTGTRTIDQEAFARQQFYAAQIAVENALSGTAAGGGISAGLIAGGVSPGGGVYAVERQLRSLLGLPTSDGRLIVPADEPASVDVRFDWHDSLARALTRRVELREQQWKIKRSQLALAASRNFAKMRVDVVGQYRWRGFGDDLFGNRSMLLGSAFDSLFDGNLQDWRLGVEITAPVGNRVGHAAVRHAELLLAREHAIYHEMERQVSHELRAAYTELDRAYAVTRSNYNRRIAAVIRLQAERQRNARGQTELDLVLDAQQQAVDAESAYYRALTDFNLALMNLHYARGSLLENYRVYLAEGPWSEHAHRSAAKLARRFRPAHFDFTLTRPPDVSLGAYPQRAGDSEPLPEPLPAAEAPRPPNAGEPVPLPEPPAP